MSQNHLRMISYQFFLSLSSYFSQTSDMEGDGDEYQDTENLVMMEDFTTRGIYILIILSLRSLISIYNIWGKT